MYRVLLAGGIASGKSTVALAMEQRGAARLDLDAISREVLSPGEPLLTAVAQRFGTDLLAADGSLKRGLLAERVFSDPQALKELEELEHPAIYERLRDHLAALDVPVAVVEIQLLEKAGPTLGLADEVVAVVAPLELRRERAILRGMTVEDFEARLARQASDDYLRAHANTVFMNDGSQDRLFAQVDVWWREREQASWQPLIRGGEADG